MKVFLRSRTATSDYRWFAIDGDGTIIPFHVSFALADRYSSLVPSGSRAALFFRDDRTIDLDGSMFGLLLLNLPTDQLGPDNKRIIVDLCVCSDELDVITGVGSLLVYHWPPTPQNLDTLLAHCQACVEHAHELYYHFGMHLRDYLHSRVPLPPVGRVRPSKTRLCARATPLRMTELLSWLTLKPSGVQAIIVASPYDAPPADTELPKVEYLLTEFADAEWQKADSVRVPPSVQPTETPSTAVQRAWAKLRALARRWG